MAINKPDAPISVGAKIMNVLFIQFDTQSADDTHAALMGAGFDMNRAIFAAYPTDEKDQPSDDGMYLMQEVMAKQ